jgi:hypothetical protein
MAPVDYSLYLVTSRDLLPPGKVSHNLAMAFGVDKLNTDPQDFYECLEEVRILVYRVSGKTHNPLPRPSDFYRR